ncbi:MAG TPA: hypothetical protein EYP34_00465 [Chromatiaceae bacterium]|nr:hypothetical protein [Chromatiaceae bacterium]
MSKASFCFFCVVSFTPVNSPGAQVYRCVQPDGSISFQQQACTNKGARIETGQAQAVWESLRSGEKSLYDQYRQHDKAKLKHKQRIARSRIKPETADDRTCWKKRQLLESVSARLRRGYKASKGNELRRRRDSYEDYLRRFCP